MAGDGLTCGQLIRHFRQEAGLTQEELAARSGYSANYLSKLERDQRQPPPVALDRLADILGLGSRERDQLRAARGHDRRVPPSQPPPLLTPQPPPLPPPVPQLLPLPPTALLGRDAELATIARLLARPDVRLVTIVGPPGVGKTRLALEVAAYRQDDHAGGVCFVDLAPLSDPDLVMPAIAQALGVRERGGRPLLDDVVAALHDRHLLLVLDNCEQVLGAAPALAELLAASAHLVVLATSRAPLRLRGEHECPLAPLALPDLTRLPTLPDAETLAQYPAVALFVERAAAVRHDFTLTADNARAVADLCVRLDGLPLAIELAAARLRLLPLPALVEHLAGRLHVLTVLTSGARDLPARQQTLRTTIDWSYHLLDEAAQRLFQRLGVFAGGFTLDAAETVCDDFGLPPKSKMDVLDGLERLADASLLHRVEPAPEDVRFGLLETLREYALERLEASGDAAAIQHRHAACYLALAEGSERQRYTSEEAATLRRLRREQANFRAALAWALEHDGALAVRLAAALWWVWEQQGTYAEGRERLAAALSRGATAPAAARAKVLLGAQKLAYEQGDLAPATAFGKQALALARQTGEPRLIMLALAEHATPVSSGGEPERGLALAGEALDLARQAGAPVDVAHALYTLGRLAYGWGNLALARSCLEENLALRRALGDTGHVASTYAWLGVVALAEGAYDEARRQFTTSLALRRETGHPARIAASLEGFAALAVAEEQGRRAARLLGAAATLRAACGVPVPATERAHYERTLAAAQSHLDPPDFAVAWAEGRPMAIDNAVDYALEAAAPA